jgi:hypothetical protein
MSTARCYTCQTLRPLADFPYRRRDGAITAVSRLKRYIAVVLLRPGANQSGKVGGGAVFRYRCIHPQAGACPETAAHRGVEGRLNPVVSRVNILAEEPHPLALDRRREEVHLGHEVEVVEFEDEGTGRDGAEEDTCRGIKQTHEVAASKLGDAEMQVERTCDACRSFG